MTTEDTIGLIIGLIGAGLGLAGMLYAFYALFVGLRKRKEPRKEQLSEKT